MDDYFPIIDENINPCRGCPDYDGDGCKSNGGCGKPQTNGDRIRAMTDEELVKLFTSGWYDGPLFTCPVKDVECESDTPCDVCLSEWLKQEVRE